MKVRETGDTHISLPGQPGDILYNSRAMLFLKTETGSIWRKKLTVAFF